jgi:ABC-type branched-subunit amino acid transport system permease subunit
MVLARIRVITGILVLGLLAAVPSFAGFRLIAYSNLLVTAILVLSLGLLSKTSGQVSLCHYGFAAVGAAAIAHFTSAFGLPWLVALLLAALLVVPIGALVAIPAIRLSGVFLALATFGFGIMLEQLVYPTNLMFGTTSSGIPAPRPGGRLGPWVFGSDKGYYFVLLAFTCATFLILLAVQDGRLGRLLRAMADSTLALQTHGTTVTTTKVLVFCVSAFFAGLSGALAAPLFEFAVGSQYSSFSSLTLFAVLVIVAIGEPWYALIAAAFLQLIPAYVNGANTSVYLQLVSGIGAATYVFAARYPLSVPMSVRRGLERLGTRRTAETAVARPGRQVAETPAVSEASEPVATPGGLARALEVRHVSVRYGGVVAVGNVTLRAPMGQITGLIGPNGAGKTTTFNACSGLTRPSGGTIFFGDRNITRLGPQKRAQAGIGRTFQTIELFDSLTVEQNIRLGREARLAGTKPWTQLRSARSDHHTIGAAAEAAINLTDISSIKGTQVGILPTGPTPCL